MAERTTGVCVGEGVWALGVLIQSGAPLSTLWVPLTNGLTVLYGRNGVGKTKVLDMIGRALRGGKPAEGRVSLHLSFGGPFENFDVGLLLALGVATGVPPRYVEEPERYIGHDPDDDDAPRFALEYAADITTALAKRAEEYGLAEGLCLIPLNGHASDHSHCGADPVELERGPRYPNPRVRKRSDLPPRAHPGSAVIRVIRWG